MVCPLWVVVVGWPVLVLRIGILLLLRGLLSIRLSSCLLLPLFGSGSGRIVLVDHIRLADIKARLDRHNSCICVIDCRLVVLAMAALIRVMVVSMRMLVLWLFGGFPFFLRVIISAVVMMATSLVLLGYEQIIRSYGLIESRSAKHGSRSPPNIGPWKRRPCRRAEIKLRLGPSSWTPWYKWTFWRQEFKWRLEPSPNRSE